MSCDNDEINCGISLNGWKLTCPICSKEKIVLEQSIANLVQAVEWEREHKRKIKEAFLKAITGNKGYIYPKDVCQNQPPEQYKGWNACLSCRFSPVCKLVYNQ